MIAKFGILYDNVSMRTKKILVSDFDGTLRQDNGDMERVRLAIEVFRGIGNTFVIATGRSYPDFDMAISRYGLSFDYVILNHGATVLDLQNRVLENLVLDDELVKTLEKELKSDLSVKCYVGDCWRNYLDFGVREVTKITAEYQSREKALERCKEINLQYADNLKCFYAGAGNLEIVSIEADKSRAIEKLQTQLNWKDEDISVIGDDINDLGMIGRYGGCVVKNAVREAKDLARREYDSVPDLIDELLSRY